MLLCWVCLHSRSFGFGCISCLRSTGIWTYLACLGTPRYLIGSRRPATRKTPEWKQPTLHLFLFRTVRSTSYRITSLALSHQWLRGGPVLAASPVPERLEMEKKTCFTCWLLLIHAVFDVYPQCPALDLHNALPPQRH